MAALPSPSKRRLDQLISSLGYCTRKEVRDLVKEGRVTLAGVTAREYDVRVYAADVLLDGEPLEAPDGLLALFHKPTGYVCTHAEDEGPTIYELLPARWFSRNPPISSVGRLDKDTSGLLLITDQGSIIQRYTSPKSQSEKVYEAEVEGGIPAELIEIFASGTLILRGEERPCLPAKLEILAPQKAKLTLTEGKYHQVRRMFASQGLSVTQLHRSHFGPYSLGDIQPGEWLMLPLT